MRVWQQLYDPFDPQGRHPRRNLFGLPSIFHRQAEAGGHRRTRRALPPQVRQSGTGEEVTRAVDQPRVSALASARAFCLRMQVETDCACFAYLEIVHYENHMDTLADLVCLLDHFRP